MIRLSAVLAQRVALLCAALLLAACATRAPRPEPGPAASAMVAIAPPVDSPEAFAMQSAREAGLGPDWRLQGRVAFAGGGDGATVQIDWTQRGGAFDIRLAAPVTGRQWRLHGDAAGALLEGLDDGPRRGPDAETLLFEATGWRLPVRQWPAWVRGARGPGPLQALSIDADGRPRGWTQLDWVVEYRDWWPGDPALPRRVFARRGEASVRLVVARWTMPEPRP